jgi:hypothetical protein
LRAKNRRRLLKKKMRRMECGICGTLEKFEYGHDVENTW